MCVCVCVCERERERERERVSAAYQCSRVSAVVSQCARPDEARERHSCTAGMPLSSNCESCSLQRCSTAVERERCGSNERIVNSIVAL